MNARLIKKLKQVEKEKNIENYFQFVLFGGTGDLAHNKLLPAFYNMLKKDILPDNFTIIATGRRYDSQEEYLAAIKNSLSSKLKLDKRIWQLLAANIEYFELNFKADADFIALKEVLEEKSAGEEIHNRLFYLATAPGFFTEIAEKLKKFDLLNLAFEDRDSKLVIEKPFGSDLKSAQKLNKNLNNIFSEENIFRIDHYLGKEMIQNIMVIRLSNPIFRALWKKEYIDNIQIYLNESEGVKNRGKYYDDTGVIKDMIQNHMLQILSLITMEEPDDLSAQEISRKKVEVFKELAEINLDNFDKHIVRGQYTSSQKEDKIIKAYREENNIPDDSMTSTFIALKLFLNNQRWQDVPIYIKSGKRLAKKEAAIAVEFNDDFHQSYLKDKGSESNLLLIKIQPEEGISLQFNTRKPGSINKILPVQMEFCHSCEQLFNSPESYEVLIHDMILGDKTLFTSWEEVYYSWKFIDKFMQKCEEENIKLHQYPALSQGPKAADDLLADDGRQWWDKKLK